MNEWLFPEDLETDAHEEFRVFIGTCFPEYFVLWTESLVSHHSVSNGGYIMIAHTNKIKSNTEILACYEGEDAVRYWDWFLNIQFFFSFSPLVKYLKKASLGYLKDYPDDFERLEIAFQAVGESLKGS